MDRTKNEDVNELLRTLREAETAHAGAKQKQSLAHGIASLDVQNQLGQFQSSRHSAASRYMLSPDGRCAESKSCGTVGTPTQERSAVAR